MPVSIRELYASIGALKQPLSKMRRAFVDDLKDLQYRPLSMMTEQDIHRGHYMDDGSVMVFSSPENSSKFAFIGKIFLLKGFIVVR